MGEWAEEGKPRLSLNLNLVTWARRRPGREEEPEFTMRKSPGTAAEVVSEAHAGWAAAMWELAPQASLRPRPSAGGEDMKAYVLQPACAVTRCSGRISRSKAG